MGVDAKLHIPEGINFDCTGCGNCCFNWPVPITDDDLNRICSLPLPGLKEEPLHVLKADIGGASGERTFTAALGKRSDGKCQFLLPDNRCQLHAEFGEESKPSMCRLFPYTFTKTPKGVFASASFASTGVLYNSGRPLSEQNETLNSMFNLFQKLHPNLSPSWSELQLIDGQPLLFEQYLEMENEFLARLKPGCQRVEKVVSAIGIETSRSIKQKHDYDRIPGIEAKPRTVDSLLVKALYEAYFPNDVYKENSCEINTAALAQSLVMPPDKVLIETAGHSISFGDFNNYRLGPLNEQGEDLLRRFAYLKIFSKLYFGPGFAGLSLVSGLNHLSILITLVRLAMKIENIDSPKSGSAIPFEQIAECVRRLERRLTVTSFSKQTKTMLEVLMSAQERAERISSLGS